jgi:hypothetical protein
MNRWEKFVWGGVAILLIVWLGGCATGKALVDACREGLCR